MGDRRRAPAKRILGVAAGRSGLPAVDLLRDQLWRAVSQNLAHLYGRGKQIHSAVLVVAASVAIQAADHGR